LTSARSACSRHYCERPGDDITTPPPSPSAGWDLIPLAEQFVNHDQFRPDPSAELAGKRFQLQFEGGPNVTVDLLDPRRLSWRSDGESIWGESGTADYEAVTIRPGIYAVTVSRLDQNSSALVVLDRGKRRALVNLTTFLGSDGAIREATSVFQAGVDEPLRSPFMPTTELIGKRVAHRYSTTHVFEHIYLNPNTYAFQGLEGPEAGVADVDRADYWKLAEQLYLFSWHERAQPFNGAVVIDLEGGRATGRLVGWDAEGRRTLQVRTGSRATLLSVTTYEGI